MIVIVGISVIRHAAAATVVFTFVGAVNKLLLRKGD